MASIPGHRVRDLFEAPSVLEGGLSVLIGHDSCAGPPPGTVVTTGSGLPIPLAAQPCHRTGGPIAEPGERRIRGERGANATSQ